MNDISSFAWSTLHNIYTNGARFAHNAIQSNPNAFYWFRWENNHINNNNNLTQPPSLSPSNISVKIIDGIDAVRSIHPNYWAVACITALSCLIVYIKLRYPFWNQVAALHTFDWHRRYLYRDRPYTIRLLPHKTRYYDTDHIQTGFFRQLTNEKIKESVELLQNHYIPTDRMFCALQEASWAAYFAEGHAHPAIVSLYNEVVHEVEGEPTEIGDAEDVQRIVKEHTKTNVVGLVTSRSVHFTIKGFGKDNGVVSFPVYFMDYFCFHREAVTPLKLRQLFSTHEFNQRVFHAAINVTLFKKEVTLCEGLVPLIQYKTYTYYLPAEVRLRAVPQNFQLVRIQREYLHHLYDFVGQLPQLNDFVLTVVADVGALVALLRANQLFAYVLRGPEEGVVQVESVEVGGKNTNVRRLNKVKLDTMYGLYFFRNAQVKNDDLEGSDTLQVVAAFCNTNNEELFFTGFVWALRECLKDMGGNTRMMMVDDIGHAQRLRKRWSMKNSTVFECECAYYVCNYVVPRSPLNTSTSFLLL